MHQDCYENFEFSHISQLNCVSLIEKYHFITLVSSNQKILYLYKSWSRHLRIRRMRVIPMIFIGLNIYLQRHADYIFVLKFIHKILYTHSHQFPLWCMYVLFWQIRIRHMNRNYIGKIENDKWHSKLYRSHTKTSKNNNNNINNKTPSQQTRGGGGECICKW